jgi:hypothetical protein
VVYVPTPVLGGFPLHWISCARFRLPARNTVAIYNIAQVIDTPARRKFLHSKKKYRTDRGSVLSHPPGNLVSMPGVRHHGPHSAQLRKMSDPPPSGCRETTPRIGLVFRPAENFDIMTAEHGPQSARVAGRTGLNAAHSRSRERRSNTGSAGSVFPAPRTAALQSLRQQRIWRQCASQPVSVRRNSVRERCIVSRDH